MSNTITVKELKGAFILGAKRLDAKKEIINELNVFPVPDGDTGTNMSMTVNTALNDIIEAEFSTHKDLCKAISMGSLKGARGNSGVILSQLFRGFYKVIKESETIDVYVLSKALSKATETAYRAVMQPKEGTILTVAKAISEKSDILANVNSDIGQFYDGLVEAGIAALEKTPEMLPVLKQAGVVDSGGAGLIEILQGAADFVNGRDTDIKIHSEKSKNTGKKAHSYGLSFDLVITDESKWKSVADLELIFSNLGKLISINEKENGIINIVTDTNDPGKVISQATKTGVIAGLKLKTYEKIDSSKIQTKLASKEPPKDLGVIAISSGKGLSEIFKGLGVDYVILGGQTMNPSTEDILDAIKEVNAKEIIVLPNNKNILLAADQAAKLCTDKKVFVVPTKTITQGVCAMVYYAPDADGQTNSTEMAEQITLIKSGEVTHSVRDTKIDGKEIKKGDFMGIGDTGILSVDKNLTKAVDKLVAELISEDSSLISIFYGEDVKESDAKKLAAKLSKKYPDFEIDLQNGTQPVYYYLLSVE